MIEEWPVRITGLWRHITGGLATAIRFLTVVAMVLYLWFMSGTLDFAAVALSNPVGGSITGGLATVIRSLTVVAMIFYLWFMFGSSDFSAAALSNPDRQLENLAALSMWKMARLLRPGQPRGRRTVEITALSTCLHTVVRRGTL